MSDVMLMGVLRMPYQMAMGGEIARRQFYASAQQATDRIEADAREIAQLREQVRIAVADIEALHAELGNGQGLPDPAHPDQCRMCGEQSENARQTNRLHRQHRKGGA